MLESASQADFRASGDIFGLLDSISLDQAEGVALDRIGQDERVPRVPAGPASGVVTLGDSSFAKVATRVFQGTPAPLAGSLAINVPDASSFPGAGSIYVGRGLASYEGPIPYTSVLPPGVGGGFSGGSYWTLVLGSGTTRFHNQGETVTLAQGGNRAVSAGTVVQTTQGNVVNATTYTLRYLATIPDGEVQLTGVQVVATVPGVGGNVVANAIAGFASAPFTNATVANPAPYTNGTSVEDDDAYRERIRDARASRSRGTPLALETFSLGVTAADEGTRVTSASVVTHPGAPVTVYVDDGSGYEEVDEGIALETFYDSALGGEIYFKVAAPRPVAKASLTSALTAPFALAPGMQWAFSVGGVVTVLTISADQFRDATNATAYEWVSAVNASAGLGWAARTAAGGTQAVVYAKAETDESIQYAPGSVTVDGNAATGFPATRSDTMALYKNDVLLSKDGAEAILASAPFASWGALGPGSEDLQLQVDGTPMGNLVGGTYAFTAADFIAAGTGYAAVGRNSLAAWAAVLEYRVPGISVQVVGSQLQVASNRGAQGSASLAVLGGTLVAKGVFAATVAPVAGADSDYTLDRNSGEGRLAAPLAAGDHLSAGSTESRGFLQSGAFGAVTLAASANWWFAVDGAAAVVPIGVNASTQLNLTSNATAWGFRERVAQASGTGAFSQVQVGDWAIFWDPALPADVRGQAFRVAAVGGAGTYFETERATVTTAGPITLPAVGLVIARTPALLAKATVSAGSNWTAATVQPLLAAVPGARAEVYRTTQLRFGTDTYAANGDAEAVAADSGAQLFGLPLGSLKRSTAARQASAEAGNSDLGTPDFHQTWVTSASSAGTQPQVDWTADPGGLGPDLGSQLVGLQSLPDSMLATGTRSASALGFASPLSAQATGGINTYNLTLRRLPYETLLHSRWYYAAPYGLAPDDQLGVLVDGDAQVKRFVVPQWRTLATVGTTYGSTNTFKDADNGGQSLAIAFGAGAAGFDFADFAVCMAARAQTHLQGDAAHYTAPPGDLSRTVLWRWYRLGADGQSARVRYLLPTAPATPLAVTVDAATNATIDTSVVLGSGTLKTGYPLAVGNAIGLVVTASSSVASVAILLGLPTTSAQRAANVTTITVNVAAVGATDHNFQSGDVLHVKNASGTYPDGSYVITRVSATQFSYSDPGANAGPTAISGDVNYGSTEATFAGASPAVVVGDVVTAGVTAGLAPLAGQPVRVDALPNPQCIQGVAPGGLGGVNTVVTWYPLFDPAAFQVYAQAAQTASAIAAAVNALAAAVPRACPISGAVIGSGAGVVDKASYVEASSTFNQWFSLTDGLNWVRTTTIPGAPSGNYQLTFKAPISATLATNSDWAHEVVKVVPRTAANVAGWLNQLGVTGLSSAAEVRLSSRARRVQIASLTAGSVGSVQGQGGTANAAAAAMVGSGTAAGGAGLATVASAAGFLGQGWALFQNAAGAPKGTFASGTVLQSLAPAVATSLLTISGTTAYTTRASATANAVVAIEPQGRFWAITDSGYGSAVSTGALQEGDYVYVAAPASPLYVGGGVQALSAANAGTFRVVRVVGSPDVGGPTIWVENPAGVAQPLAEVRLAYLTAASLVPGDAVSISTSLWDGPGGSNQGVYTVLDVGNSGSGSYTNAAVFTLGAALHAVGSPAAALGANAPLVQATEGTGCRLFKRVLGIAPNQANPSYSDLKLDSGILAQRLGAAFGTVAYALDKLAFPLDEAVGLDGYRHAVGLIGAVNQVLYGDLANPTALPGVVAAGETVNVEGPQVLRVQVSIAIRLLTGAVAGDVLARVQSAVAAVINSTDVGQSIALSDLVRAASRVGGVRSAVMVSPTATSGSDLIAVQPNEKPRVLDVDADVLVSLIGG